MQLGKKEPIHWCKGKSEKRNPMGLKRKAIGPAGQVVEMSLANGKASRHIIGNTYAQLIEHEKQGRGWVWYDDCSDCPPVPAPKNPGDDVDLSGHCKECRKRELLIATRREAQNARGTEYAKLFETRLDKLAEVLERGMVGNVKPTVSQEQLAEVMTAAPPVPKGKSAK